MKFNNLALGTVLEAPSPASSGTTLKLQDGEGARFPTPSTDGDFFVTAFPANEIPHIGNAEIVRVTAKATDTFDIVRAQRGTTAKSIDEDWIVLQGIYVEDIWSPDLWQIRGLEGVTVTRQSTDNPTVTLRFNKDVRPFIWKGCRIKATENSIVHYFIVSADPVFSSPNTDVTCLSEIDTATPTQAKNLIGATTISDVAYAPPKTYPKGFPMAKQSWTVKVQNATDVEQTTPSGATWYNLGSINLSIPIGDWEIGYFVVVWFAGSSNLLAGYTTLSDANNTEDTEMTLVTASVTTQAFGSHSINKRETVTTKKTKYLNARRGGSALTYIRFFGTQSTSLIRATSTLL